jgi:hypothetical protein
MSKALRGISNAVQSVLGKSLESTERVTTKSEAFETAMEVVAYATVAYAGAGAAQAAAGGSAAGAGSTAAAGAGSTTAAGAGGTAATGAGSAAAVSGATASSGVTLAQAAKTAASVYSAVQTLQGPKNVPAVPTPDLGSYFVDDSIRPAEKASDTAPQTASVVALDNGGGGGSNGLWIGATVLFIVLGLMARKSKLG